MLALSLAPATSRGQLRNQMNHEQAIEALVKEIELVCTENRCSEPTSKQSESDDRQYALLTILARVRSIGTDQATTDCTKVQILRNVLTRHLALFESNMLYRPGAGSLLIHSNRVLQETEPLESPPAPLLAPA